MILENCPQCHKKLAPPSNTNNCQSCLACGWPNESQIAKTQLNLNINGQAIKIDAIQLSGIAGSIILFFGAFAPIIGTPLGSTPLPSEAQGIIIASSVASLILTFQKAYKWLFLSGCGPALTVTYILFRFFTTIAEAKSSINSELTNNPFRGLADAAVDSIHLDWGIALLIIGVGLILNSARLAIVTKLSSKSKKNLTVFSLQSEPEKSIFPLPLTPQEKQEELYIWQTYINGGIQAVHNKYPRFVYRKLIDLTQQSPKISDFVPESLKIQILKKWEADKEKHGNLIIFVALVFAFLIVFLLIIAST